MQKLAAIYVRVSGDRQKEEATIESQIDSCQTYAKKQGYLIPEGWVFKDDGFRGGTLRRPGLEELRNVIQENAPDIVIVLCPDRIARKVSSQYILEDEFRRFGTTLVFLDQPTTTPTPEEQLSIHCRAVFAEYEREKIVERCSRGRNYKARQGSLSVLPSAPYGFDYIPKHKARAGQYKINPKHSAVVKEIYHMYTSQHWPIEKICRELDTRGISTPRNGVAWDHATVRDILSNTAYIGIVYFGKTERCEVQGPMKIVRKKSGKVLKGEIRYRKSRPKEDWIPIAVPGFLEEVQFYRAQELLKTNKAKAARNTKRPSILQGLLVCKKCGLPLYKKQRGKSSYYCCKSKLERKTVSCGASNIHQEMLDELIWSDVMNLLKNPELIKAELDKMALDGTENNPQDRKREELQRSLKRVLAQRDKLLDAYQETDCLTIDEFKKRMQNLNKEKVDLEKALNSHKAAEILLKSSIEIKMTIDHCVNRLAKSSDALDVLEKQKVLRLLIDEIIVDENNVTIRHCIPLNKSVTEADMCPLSGDRYFGLSGLF